MVEQSKSRFKTLSTKLIDIFMIHRFFFQSQIRVLEKLKQLMRSYSAVLTNTNRFTFLNKVFYINRRFDPILMLTYPTEISFLKEAIKDFKPKRVVDVGANIGQWGSTFKYFYPESNLYSFEPFPQAFNVLKKNSDKISGWVIYDWAIGDPKDGFLYLSKEGSAEHSLVDRDHGLEKIKITTKVLSRGFVPKNVDLLKIDTEGYDLTVIKNTKGLIIKYLSIEVDVKGLKNNLAEIQKTIKKHWHRNSDLLGIQTLWAGSPKGNAIFQINKPEGNSRSLL